MADTAPNPDAAPTSDAAPPPATAGDTNPRAPLDDIMIAMDVVDTLRHDREMAERELDEDGRRDKLIERLKEIYKGQGIEVPDRILEEGVKALEEQRFLYRPPKDSLATRLAKIYVTRDTWGRMAGGLLLGIAITWGGWYLMVERPRQARIAAARAELTTTLPADLKASVERIAATGADDTVKARANTLMAQGLKAAAAGDRKAARTALTDLEDIRSRLQASYTIRIVNRRGELTGFWRVPRVNPNARNFYMVVEAIGDDGKVVPLDILNEETQKRERVTTWTIRVPEKVFDQIRADKADDGIIQRNTVAIKRRGKLEPDWQIQTAGGALTHWTKPR